MNWHEFFTYDAETGELFWKERPPSHFKRPGWATTFNRKCAGKSAIKKGHAAYKVVTFSINGKVFTQYAHRIIYEMHFGSLPNGVQIDHINGNKLDNRPCNLRSCSRSQNGMNVKGRRHSRSGLKGVAPSDKKWMAYIVIDGKMKCLGIFPTKGAAAVVHAKASLRHHGKFSVFYREQAAINAMRR